MYFKKKSMTGGLSTLRAMFDWWIEKC